MENFELVLGNRDIETARKIMKEKFHELRNEFVPIQNSGKNSWRSKGSVPIDDQLQRTINKKHQLHRRWIHTRTEDSRLDYVRARNKVKTMMRRTKRSFERDISTCAKTNPKKFWSYIRRKLKTRAGIAPLLEDPEDPDALQYSDIDKANILQQQFCNVFVSEPAGEIPTLDRIVGNAMPEIEFTEEGVAQVIKSFQLDKSCGPDEIDVIMLHELLEYMTKAITS